MFTHPALRPIAEAKPGDGPVLLYSDQVSPMWAPHVKASVELGWIGDGNVPGAHTARYGFFEHFALGEFRWTHYMLVPDPSPASAEPEEAMHAKAPTASEVGYGVYSVDVRIGATAYIRASSAAEALSLARDLANDGLELLPQGGEPPISGRRYDDPALPDLSLSPAMTIHGPDAGAIPDLVHELEAPNEEVGDAKCRVCGEPADGGEGWDGMCGSCADQAADEDDGETA